MADLRKNIAGVLLAALLSASLTGCFRSEAVKPGETGGAGRYVPVEKTEDTAAESGETNSTKTDTDRYNPPPLDNRQESETSAETDAVKETAANGVGKDTIQSGETQQTSGGDGEISYKIENGKYVYSFPEPDRSGMNDLSGLKAMSKALFSDQGNDTTGSWWYGKTQRDLTTGEVTYVWDRAADTIALIEKYGGIYRQHEDEKVCYFTFDCGYENGYTDPLLDVLKEKNVPGIFFVTGQYVDTAGDQVRRMIDEGHIIGNHTENHLNATTITPETFREEIESVENKMEQLYGYDEPMLYWRPPYGGCSEYVLAMAQKMGLHTVLWSFAYYDYDTENQPDYATALQKAKEGLHPGCVYLFHTVSKTNSEILGELIDWIRGQGYEIRPICG